jgi:Ubiquitin carboxyl-terminal hydrolase 47 C-terminal
MGKPTKPGEMRIIVYLAEKIIPEEDMNSHTFKEVLETVIHGDDTAAQVKSKLAEEVKSLGYDWDPTKMRLREKAAERMIKVYRNQQMRLQGVIDKKCVAVELIDGPEKFAPKDTLLICRIWDPATLELGPRFEVIVDSHLNLSQLGNKIIEKNDSIKVRKLK